MKALTIKDLKKACEYQIKIGHGNKTIMISDDDEGNGYHYLFYAFTNANELVEEDSIFPSIATLENTIILG